VTKLLPSNDFRFQRGGSEGSSSGRAGPGQESDDLRAYAIRCVYARVAGSRGWWRQGT